MLTGNVLEPSSGKKPESAIILLHGLGDSGAGLMGLGEEWRSGLPNTVFFAPNAPFKCAYMGYQWFSPDDWTPSVVLEGIKNAAVYLDVYIDMIINDRGILSKNLALVGFSQGTMMSLYVAPRREKALAGVVGYSGALIGGETLHLEKKSSPEILLVHGMRDDVLPFAAMGQAESGLKNAGMTVSTLACSNIGHSIDEAGLSAGLAFLRKNLY